MPPNIPVCLYCDFYSLNSDTAPHLMHSIMVNAIKKTYHGRNLAKMTLSHWTVPGETATIKTA